jgi:hypothetical protein
MSIIMLVGAFVVIATIVAFVIISKGSPEPTVASMLRSTDGKKDSDR